MPHRMLLIGAVVILAILLLLILVVTATTQDTFTVVGRIDEEQQIDLGEEGPSVGDLYVFCGALFDEAESSPDASSW